MSLFFQIALFTVGCFIGCGIVAVSIWFVKKHFNIAGLTIMQSYQTMKYGYHFIETIDNYDLEINVHRVAMNQDNQMACFYRRGYPLYITEKGRAVCMSPVLKSVKALTWNMQTNIIYDKF